MRKTYTPGELRLLAKQSGPQWRDAAKAALGYAADALEAADRVIRERQSPQADAPPQRQPMDSEHRKAIMESAINGKTDMGDMEYVSWIIDATERAHGIGVNHER